MRLTDLVKDPRDRSRELACIPLMLARLGADELLPDSDLVLRVGDEILFCGAWDVPARMEWTRNNGNALAYVVTGEAIAAGRLWRWLTEKPRHQELRK